MRSVTMFKLKRTFNYLSKSFKNQNFRDTTPIDHKIQLT